MDKREAELLQHTEHDIREEQLHAHEGFITAQIGQEAARRVRCMNRHILTDNVIRSQLQL